MKRIEVVTMSGKIEAYQVADGANLFDSLRSFGYSTENTRVEYAHQVADSTTAVSEDGIVALTPQKVSGGSF